MTELTEAKVQEMIQQSERNLSRKMEDIQALLEKGARSDKYQADTLDLILGQQKTLLTAFSEMPQGIRQLLSTSISKVVQDEVTKALAIQIPKIVQAVSQQFKKPGERYADDEMVEKPIPEGFKKRLQAINDAVQSGAKTKEEVFQTTSGVVYKGKGITRMEEHKNGSISYDTINLRSGRVAHGQIEGGDYVKKSIRSEDGQFSHKIIGHRANIIDKLDETAKTLDEKKEMVREYREKHPRGESR